MGYETMLIPQDIIRRDIVRVKDTANNEAIQLIKGIALYGKRINYNVIVEGILTNDRCGDMLRDLYQDFDESYAFCFNMSFEETLRRHQTKSNSNEFSEHEMREWWVENDYLKVENEITINSSFSEDYTVKLILDTIGKSSKLIN